MKLSELKKSMLYKIKCESYAGKQSVGVALLSFYYSTTDYEE